MNISDYRSDFAAFSSAIELAHYRHRAGLEPELGTEAIYERYGELFTPDAIDTLQKALDETPAHRETERAGLRSLASSARIGYLEAEAEELTDERTRCEAAARVQWRDESLPINSIPKLISNEPVAARRRQLTTRWLDALSRCNDLRAARFESFRESALALGFDSYRALYEEVSGTDYERLAASTDGFLEQTEAAYTSSLAKIVARDLPDVTFDELQYADYFIFQRMPRLDPFFAARELMPTYGAAMAGFGIRVERQHNIHIDDEARPFKNPRAACFRINPPDDVRLLIAPVGGSYDYTVLFHEAGHAQHFGWTSRDLFKQHPEFVYAPDQAVSEGYAFLLNNLFLDAGWLAEHRNVSAERAREIVRDLATLTCCNVRRRCASLRYELELHAASRPRSEQLAATYTTGLSQATRFSRDPAMSLVEVDDGFYTAAYLRAWAFEVSLREHLRTRYGRRWWASRKCGDELIDLWNTASRYTAEELGRLIGFGELSFELLAESLLAAMKED
ncbi:MAG TPA: hypothetical protein VF723_02235 [Pyrinomonadaceae bacterium]|jgi:hypothetical protein